MRLVKAGDILYNKRCFFLLGAGERFGPQAAVEKARGPLKQRGIMENEGDRV
jgi:hypothetical protein